MPGLGLEIGQKNDHEILFKTIVKTTSDIPNKKSLRVYVPPVVSQGNTGFCWAFAGAALKATQEAIETGRTHQLSPLYIAKKGKEIDGKPNTEGTVSDTIFKVLSKYGTISERLYPFGGYKGNLEFPEDNLGFAPKYKTSEVVTKLTSPEEIMQALSMDKPVTIGLIVTSQLYDMYNLAEAYMPLPENGYILGGHKMLLTGYDKMLAHGENTGFFDVMNSWGTSWGNRGFAWLPFDYLTYKTKDFGMTFFIDAETVVDLKNDPITENVISMNIGETDVKVNGEIVKWEIAPVIKNDRTLVPLRRISEILGYNVGWEDSSKMITLNKDSHKIVMFLGSNVVLADGTPQTWDVAPQISEQADYTLVPLRYIAELLGFTVIWKEDTQEITLVKEG